MMLNGKNIVCLKLVDTNTDKVCFCLIFYKLYLLILHYIRMLILLEMLQIGLAISTKVNGSIHTI